MTNRAKLLEANGERENRKVWRQGKKETRNRTKYKILRRQLLRRVIRLQSFLFRRRNTNAPRCGIAENWNILICISLNKNRVHCLNTSF